MTTYKLYLQGMFQFTYTNSWRNNILLFLDMNWSNIYGEAFVVNYTKLFLTQLTCIPTIVWANLIHLILKVKQFKKKSTQSTMHIWIQYMCTGTLTTRAILFQN